MKKLVFINFLILLFLLVPFRLYSWNGDFAISCSKNSWATPADISSLNVAWKFGGSGNFGASGSPNKVLTLNCVASPSSPGEIDAGTFYFRIIKFEDPNWFSWGGDATSGNDEEISLNVFSETVINGNAYQDSKAAYFYATEGKTYQILFQANPNGGTGTSTCVVLEFDNNTSGISSVSDSDFCYAGGNLQVTINASSDPPDDQKFWIRYIYNDESFSSDGKFVGATMSASSQSVNVDIPISTSDSYTSVEYYVLTTESTNVPSNANVDAGTLWIENNNTSNFTQTIDNTWKTNGTNNWNTASNWYQEAVPTSSDNVTIPSGNTLPTISSGSMNCFHLRVLPLSSLTISGGDLTCAGDVTVLSNSDGTGSLNDLTSGSLSITGIFTIERYLSQDIYHYISSPINYPQGNLSYYFNQLSLGLASGDNFRRYETATNTWIDILNGPDGTYGNSDDLMDEETFQQGMGYAIAYAGENKTLSLTGSPNNGSISVAVSSGGVGNNSGANFIGNPYPSTVQASSFISDNSSILSGKLYFWDEPSSGDFGKSDYATRTSSAGNPGGGGNSPTDFIDPGQGFFVVAESDGNVTFQNSQRVHGSSVFFKNESAIKDFKLSVKNLETKDQNTITVVFDENSTEGFDKLYDAPKWQGNPDLALYTRLGDKELAINSLPELTDPVMVSVGLKAQNTGAYKFSVHTIDNFDPGTPIVLEDKLTGDQTDLTVNPEYYFTVGESGAFNNRFVLYFKSAVGMDEIEPVNQPLITLQNNQLQIKNLEAGAYQLRITDITGRTVLVDDFAAEQTYGLPVSLKTGIYIVEIITENHIFADKLFVK